MDEHKRDRVDRIRAEIDGQEKLAPEAKDGLQNLLDADVESSNGTPDKIGAMAKTLGLFIEQWVRHVVRNPELIEAAVQRHATACAGRIALEEKVKATPAPLPAGVTPRLAPWYAFRWQLTVFACVAVFSPWFPQICSTVKGFFT